MLATGGAFEFREQGATNQRGGAVKMFISDCFVCLENTTTSGALTSHLCVCVCVYVRTRVCMCAYNKSFVYT